MGGDPKAKVCGGVDPYRMMDWLCGDWIGSMYCVGPGPEIKPPGLNW